MRTSIMRLNAVLAAGVMLGALGASSPTSASGVGPGFRMSAAATSHVVTSPGTRLWVSRYDSAGVSRDHARSVAVSPGGGKVFVTGSSGRAAATIAYNAATGAQVWVKRYTGPGDRGASGEAVAVSPVGARVFVTGVSRGATSGEDYATIAYNAATGVRLWLKHYNGPGNRNDNATSLAVSPDGKTVFVTGRSRGVATADDYATIAYDAVTGAQLWLARYKGPGNASDAANSIAVGPGGSRVFVTGSGGGSYATVAYDARTGQQLWVSRYSHAGEVSSAFSVAVGPGGGKVFVTGMSSVTAVTVAYDAVTGAQLWANRYAGQGGHGAMAVKVIASPRQGSVFVTGISGVVLTSNDVTIAYNAFTGARQWLRIYPLASSATAMAVSSDGREVYVTGAGSSRSTGDDYMTLAYQASNGAQLWVRRYNGPASSVDVAWSVAVVPGGHRVFVTGESAATKSLDDFDYATVAYAG
jgi:outer membrane protein assembly factor BamB